MNLPNKLTVLRLILVPFFVAALFVPIPHHMLIALLIFAAASFTDHLDGRIARKYNLITDFGKFLDPVADKVLVISALVSFVPLGHAELWAVLVIIAREFMVTSVRLVAADSGKVIAANSWGKFKTISQLVAILVILILQYIQELISLGIVPSFSVGAADSGLFFALIGHSLILISVFFTVLSGGIYLKQNWHLIKTAK